MESRKQERERVFCISIRKNIDKGFVFPPPIKLKEVLIDKLEPVEDIDEKYYLSENFIKLCHQRNERNEKKCIQIARIAAFNYEQSSRVYSIKGLSPTIVTNGGGGHEIKIADNRPIIRVTEATIGDSINIAYPNSKTRRGRVGHGIAQTLTCCQQQVVVTEGRSENEKLRVRKLTPKECWRLMGFDDIDFEKAQVINSDTQLYKQAGNSIVVNVIEAILGNLLTREKSRWLDELLEDDAYDLCPDCMKSLNICLQNHSWIDD